MTGPAFSQFTLTTNAAALQNICGTANVKVVFVAQNKLWIVDFSEATPQARSVNVISQPQGPVISPDGNAICYAQGVSDDPPIGGTSSAWICDFSQAGNPRQIVSPGWAPRFEQNASGLSLVYSTCGYPDVGKSNCWNGCGKTMKIDTASKTVTELWSAGSWFGGLSFNGQWLCTGERSLNAFMIDRTNPASAPCTLHTLHVKTNGANADTVIRLQTCNPSISESRAFPDAMMYLDFGSSTIQTSKCYAPVLGQWGVHGRIFISRASGAMVKYYDVPAQPPTVSYDNAVGNGEIVDKQWDYPEWSNHPYFAAATLNLDRLWSNLAAGEMQREEAVYLINLHDSTYTRLLQITDTSSSNTINIKWPWIWIQTPSSIAQTEDTTWLNRPIGSAAIRPASGRGVSIKAGANLFVYNGVLRSPLPLDHLTFYSLKGECIGKTALRGAMRAEIPSSIAGNAALLIACSFSNGGGEVFHLVNTGKR